MVVFEVLAVFFRHYLKLLRLVLLEFAVAFDPFLVEIGPVEVGVRLRVHFKYVEVEVFSHCAVLDVLDVGRFA